MELFYFCIGIFGLFGVTIFLIYLINRWFEELEDQINDPTK